MAVEAGERLLHIKRTIGLIRTLLAGLTIDDLKSGPHVRAAFERYLEIISEASRHIPEPWRLSLAPDLPWRPIANLGNVLRHAYEGVDVDILWAVYEGELDQLEQAVDTMLAAHPPKGAV